MSSLSTMSRILAIFAFVGCFWGQWHPDLAAQEPGGLPVEIVRLIQNGPEGGVERRWPVDGAAHPPISTNSESLVRRSVDGGTTRFLERFTTRFAAEHPESELRLKSSVESLTGTHVRFGQFYKGLEVDGAEISIHFNRTGGIRLVQARYFAGIELDVTPRVSSEEAIRTAEAHQGGRTLARPSRAVLVVRPMASVLLAEKVQKGYRLAYRVVVASRRPASVLQHFIDATSGEPIDRRQLLRFAEGHGRVFDPNPVVALKNQNLADQDDARDAVPLAAYSDVVLLGLDGSGFLDGTFVSTALTPNRANQPSLEFFYFRDDPRFEEVMVYYHVDAALRYLRGLGFRFVDDWQVPVHAHDSDEDNSYYDTTEKSLLFGDGLVDDAEDAEVIVHELGHAIQDRQVEGFGPSNAHEAQAIGEGYCDFLAGAYFAPVSDGFGDTVMFEWDFSPFIEAARRLDTDKRYPEDLSGSIHRDGEIWSAALWEILGELGRDETVRLVTESQFLYSIDVGFSEAAAALLATDRALHDGQNGPFIGGVLVKRGFLTPPTLVADAFEPNDDRSVATVLEPAVVGRALSIATPEDVDHFVFSVENGPRRVSIGFDFLSFYGGLSYDLLATDGSVLGSERSQRQGVFELESGDYHLVVSGVDGGTNDYVLDVLIDSHGETAASATPIALGDEVSGFIEFAGDVDSFSFGVEAGQKVEVVVRTVGSNLSAAARVFLPDGNVWLAGDASVRPGGELTLAGEAPVSGRYVVALSASAEVRESFGGAKYGYVLSVGLQPEDLHPACETGGSTDITFGSVGRGVINTFGDRDGFRFEGKGGDVVSLSAAPVLGSSLDITLALYAPGGEQLQFVDFQGESGAENLAFFELPSTGAYCLEVGAYEDAQAGSLFGYRVDLFQPDRVDDDHGDGDGTATVIAVGERLQGVIDFPGDVDAFRLPLEAGQRVILDVDAEALGSRLDPVLTLVNAARQLVAESDDHGASLDSLIDFEVSETGVYGLVLRDFNGNGGEESFYTIQVRGESFADELGPLSLVRDAAGGLVLRFLGRLDDRYVLEATTGFAAWVPVGDPSGFSGRLNQSIVVDDGEPVRFYRVRRLGPLP